MKFRTFILPVFLLYRLIGVYLVQTSFVPDEYWQSLEVAHNLVFGYGYLTWEWKKHIRSCFYPGLIAMLYRYLPEYRVVLIQAPRICQAILSAIGDYYTFKLSTKLFGNMSGIWTIYCILTSWFLFYCSPRTLTNMAETSITACGLYFYYWPRKPKGTRYQYIYLWFVGLSAMVRPTAVILWMPLYLWHAWRERRSIVLFITKSIFKGTVLLFIVFMVDKKCFGQSVITPYRFFLFNWTNDIGAFYGTHPWHWYFTIGFPTVMTAHLIPFALGISATRIRVIIYLLILWFIVVLSFASHKEIRFLLPIMPLSMCLCGTSLNKLYNDRMVLWKWKMKPKALILICFVIMGNAPIIFYSGMIHQRGTLDAVTYLSKSVNENSSVLFLMPCHSTPYYSHIHKNITLKFLTCEPNFNNEADYVDEADQFYSNPRDWLDSYISSTNQVSSSINNSSCTETVFSKIPSHIVMFNELYTSIFEFLYKYKYRLCFSAKHSDFVEGRVGTHVHIYCTDK